LSLPDTGRGITRDATAALVLARFRPRGKH